MINNTLQQFKEATDALRTRMGNKLPTDTWRDIQREAHDRAFVVAGAAKADLLADLARAVDDSITKGLGQDYFRKEFDKIVAKHGWAFKGERNWRTRMIYQTNLQVSYAAGRLRQLRDPDLQKLKPYWKYVHSDSALNPRPLHVSWNGLVLKADHDWFKTHYPPNGWGCKCRVVAVTKKEFERASKNTPPDNGSRPIDGRNVPNGIDEGWDYMPGASQLEQLVGKKLATLPEPLANAMRRQTNVDVVPSGERDIDVIAESSLNVILSVHRLPPMQPIKISRNVRMDRRGEYDPDSRVLSVDVKTDKIDPEFVFVHEVGHLLDEELLGIRSAILSQTSIRHKLARQVLTEIKASQRYRYLEKSKDPFRSYLLLEHELWARAYAQFIAKRSGHPVLLSNIRYHLSRNDNDFFFAQHWDDEDFSAIESAIENLLNSEGLL